MAALKLAGGPDTKLLARLRDSPAAQTLGNTPLVRLRWISDSPVTRIFAKLEMVSLGGSVKDRTAYSMLEAAIVAGEVGYHSTIVESSSGNTGVGLAQICAALGLKFTCVVDPKTTPTNIKLLRSFGATIDLVEDADSGAGGFLKARIRRVREIVDRDESAFWPNQYENPACAEIHAKTTMLEIERDLRYEPDFLYCATSTCGTLKGCSDFVSARGWKTKLVGVDANDSRVFGEPSGSRQFPGMGASVRPPMASLVRPPHVYRVSDEECLAGCRYLAMNEGVLAGPSSGAVVTAARRLIDDVPGAENGVHLLLFADRGDRYLESGLNLTEDHAPI